MSVDNMNKYRDVGGFKFESSDGEGEEQQIESEFRLGWVEFNVFLRFLDSLVQERSFY